jgi:hypothetical protein
MKSLFKIYTLRFIFYILFVYSLPFTLYASLGISTEFNNIFIENLQIGQEYNLTQMFNLPCKAKNNSDKKVKIKIQPVKPVQQSLKPGFEVIPSTDWIKILNPEISVEPQGFAVSDLVVKIPDDKTLLGRKFQVNIWFYISSVEGESGLLSMTPGVEGSLLFSISAEIKKQKVKPVDLSFELSPAEVYKVFTSTDNFVGSVEIKNMSKKTVLYEITQANPKDMNIHIKEGYELLPENFSLLVVPNRLKIKKGSSKKFDIFCVSKLSLEYIGKKYFGLVEIKTTSKGISGSKFVKIYLDVR